MATLRDHTKKTFFKGLCIFTTNYYTITWHCGHISIYNLFKQGKIRSHLLPLITSASIVVFTMASPQTAMFLQHSPNFHWNARQVMDINTNQPWYAILSVKLPKADSYGCIRDHPRAKEVVQQLGQMSPTPVPALAMQRFLTSLLCNHWWVHHWCVFGSPQNCKT